MKPKKFGTLFALAVITFVAFVIYGWNSSGLADSNNIFRVGREVIKYNGETSSSVGDMKDKTPEGPDVQTIVLAYTCVFEKMLLNDIIPAFKEHWKAKTGKDIRFITAWSLPDFDTLATQAYDKPVQVLLQTTNADPISRGYKTEALIATQARAFVVRKGNPKNITTYNDLTREGVEIVMISPTGSSGVFHFIGMYGAFMREMDSITGIKNEYFVEQNLRKVYRNLVGTPVKGQFTRQLFNKGVGDVLIDQEPSARAAVKKNPELYDYVIPPYNGLYELKAFTMKKNIKNEDKEAIEEFIKFLLTDQIQEVFAKAGWRPANPEVFARHSEFVALDHPWTVDYLGNLNDVKRTLILEKLAKIVREETNKERSANEYSN